MSGSSIPEKIRKLMALAMPGSGASPEEAASAAAMAAMLSAKYNIELASIKTSEADRKVFKQAEPITSALPRDKAAHMLLARAVADLYGCTFLINIAHNSNKIRFVGQPHNTALCDHWMTYLWDAGSRYAAQFLKNTSHTSQKERYKADGSFRLFYATEVSARLARKLAEMKRHGIDQTSTGTALVVSTWFETERREVRSWMEQNMRLKTTKTRHKPLDVSAAVAGTSAGRAVNISDHIGTRPAPVAGLIR